MNEKNRMILLVVVVVIAIGLLIGMIFKSTEPARDTAELNNAMEEWLKLSPEEQSRRMGSGSAAPEQPAQPAQPVQPTAPY